MGNYNLKNIMLGIGIGLVLSSMVNISIGNKEPTIEEIKKEAAKYNLIVLTKEEIMKPSPTPIVTPTPTVAPIVAPTTAAKPTTAPSLTPTPQAPGQKITVNIKSGMSSESVANLLMEAGVIKDAKAFLKRLGELGLDSKLKIGSYEITKGSGYEEIIKILTK